MSTLYEDCELFFHVCHPSFSNSFVFTGCTRCIPRTRERPCADKEAGTDAEGNSWLALSSQVPEDAVKLCCFADVHARLPVPFEIPTGETDDSLLLFYSFQPAVLIILGLYV